MWFHSCCLLASSGWVLSCLLSCVPGSLASSSLLLPSDHCHLSLRCHLGPGCRCAVGLDELVCPMAYMGRAGQWPSHCLVVHLAGANLWVIPDTGISWHQGCDTFEGALCHGLRWPGWSSLPQQGGQLEGEGTSSHQAHVGAPPMSKVGPGSLEQQHWPIGYPPSPTVRSLGLHRVGRWGGALFLLPTSLGPACAHPLGPAPGTLADKP